MRVSATFIVTALRGLHTSYRGLVWSAFVSIRDNDELSLSEDAQQWQQQKIEQLEALLEELRGQDELLTSALWRLAHYDSLTHSGDPLAQPLRSSGMDPDSPWLRERLDQNYKEVLCEIAQKLVQRMKNPEALMVSYYTDREDERIVPQEWRTLANTAEGLFGEEGERLADALHHVDRVWLELSPSERRQQREAEEAARRVD